MSTFRVIRGLAVVVVCIGLFAAPAGAVQAPGGGAPVAPRNTPPGLSAASLVKRAEPDRPMSITLTLDLRDHAGVDALIAAQQDPSSPLYHQWITPEEFQARFGPTADDLKDVKDFLAAEGFQNVTQVTSTHIAAEGTVELVERALQVQIDDYDYDGRRVFANDRAPVLPAELASKVVHVGGLDDLTVMKPSHGPTAPVDEGYVTAGQNFMLARDSQVAYGQKAGYFDLGKKGNSGAEMAIASSFNVNVSDVNDQLTRQGGGGAGYNTLVAAASGAHSIQVICVPGTGAGTGCTFVNNGGASADSLETNWDVSLAASIANDNHFGVYLTQTQTQSAFSVLYQYLADRAGTIHVVTHSWGGCLSLNDPAVVAADENAFAQAAAGGQAWFVATGDTGSNGCNGAGGINPDVGYPAASAYVTAVGGSELNHNAAGTFGADGWITGYPVNGEAACSNGGGGEATDGILGPRPSWQSGTGVTGTYRLLPDVSLHYGTCGAPGAGKAYLATLGGSLLGVGGTSGSAPEWAGFWAVANQVVGTNLGHAAPILFRILRSEGGTSYANCFHDITTGNNGAYPAGVGFDKATGIGTPKFNGLYPALQTLFAPANSGCFTDTTQPDFQAGTPTNVNATFSPGDLRLAITAGGQALNAQNTNVSGSGIDITSTQWLGQDFVPTVTGNLTRVDFALLCSSCSGTNPNIVVELRNTSGGVPTGVLATTAITGFASPAGIVYYSATFPSPASVTSGTMYAVTLRLTANRSAGSYFALLSSSDVYAPAPGVGSTTSGASWGTLPGNADLGFQTYITTTPSYAASGDFIAVVNDSNPSGSGTPHLSSLSWTASTPANTTLKFQLATSVSEGGPFNFIGPDGTAATFFTTSPATLPGELFRGRYFQWRAFLSTTNAAATPVLNDVTVCYNNTCAGLPSPPASASNNGPICAGATLQLNAAAVSGATYSWTGPNGFTSALQNPTIPGATAAATGTYNVKAVIGSCQSANVPTSATVTATGGACNDGNACTQTDTCQAGACSGGNPVVCPSDACHNAGACNPANGVCAAGTTKYNTACDDGNACTSGDTCGMRLVENFDQAALPGIPGTWTTALVTGNAGDQAWSTVSSSSQTSPLSAFTDDPSHVTDKVLVSPSFTVTSSPGQAFVNFFHRYQLEGGFDGGVLEISINGGAYNDILAAGGSFVTGGYNAAISTLHGNPIGGRQAWTGTSAGYPSYMQTTANLPAAAAGQSVRLKWRVATDNSVPSTGQNLDSIRVIDDFPAMTCIGLPAASAQEVGIITAAADKINYTFPATLGATDYDAVRGLITGLPVGPGFGDEACGGHLGGPAFSDGSAPPVGNAYWYIARGRNSCGVGSWGTRSNGTPNTTATCP